jgi:hypothetical protein
MKNAKLLKLMKLYSYIPVAKKNIYFSLARYLWNKISSSLVQISNRWEVVLGYAVKLLLRVREVLNIYFNAEAIYLKLECT